MYVSDRKRGRKAVNKVKNKASYSYRFVSRVAGPTINERDTSRISNDKCAMNDAFVVTSSRRL